jgi:tetratricopeptide (TPR) repeat protein
LATDHPNAAAVHVQRGALEAGRGNLPAARAAFERALSREPQSLEAWAGLVSLDIRSGDTDAVRDRVGKRLSTGPPSPELLLVAGRAYAGIHDLGAAERALRQAIDADPNFLPAYLTLGQIYLRQRKLAPARQEFEALAARQSRPVGALTMAGMILYAEGNTDKARKRFEQVLSIDAGAAVAANNLAWIHAESGENLDVALQLAQKATVAVPDSPEMLDTLGWVYYKKKQPDLAIPAFSRAARNAGDNPIYYYHLGLAYGQAGDPAQARAALERALNLKKDFPGAEDARRALSALPAGDAR